MKLLFSTEALARKIAQDPDDEPGGLLAVSPRILQQAEKRADRAWDGSQEDAERLVFSEIISRPKASSHIVPSAL